MCLGQSPAYSGNVSLAFNPPSGHVSSHHHVVFDDECCLVSSLRSNTVPSNWPDLAPKSTDSVTNENADSYKLWFQKYFLNLNDLEVFLHITFDNSTTSAHYSVDNIVRNVSTTDYLEVNSTLPSSEGVIHHNPTLVKSYSIV